MFGKHLLALSINNMKIPTVALQTGERYREIAAIYEKVKSWV